MLSPEGMNSCLPNDTVLPSRRARSGASARRLEHASPSPLRAHTRKPRETDRRNVRAGPATPQHHADSPRNTSKALSADRAPRRAGRVGRTLIVETLYAKSANGQSLSRDSCPAGGTMVSRNAHFATGCSPPQRLVRDNAGDYWGPGFGTKRALCIVYEPTSRCSSCPVRCDADDVHGGGERGMRRRAGVRRHRRRLGRWRPLERSRSQTRSRFR